MGATSVSFPTIEARVKKAAEVLKVPQSEVEGILKSDFGVEPNEDGLALLDAQTTTEQFLVDTMNKLTWPKLKILAVAAILKGRDPFAKVEDAAQSTNDGSNKQPPKDVPVENPSIIAQTVVELTKSLRDPKQMKDKELLELYDKERDYEVGQEIHRRSSYQYTIVLKPGADKDGKKDIDIDMSLELLKRSRRMVNPSLVRQGDIFVNVYRVSELDPEENVVETCPFDGEIVYRNYCEHCGSDFSKIGDDEKAYIKLITEVESFDKASRSDRKDVLISAGKGLNDLRLTWPKISRKFDELKLLNDLPKFRKSRTLPSQRPADPFHVSGNRSF